MMGEKGLTERPMLANKIVTGNCIFHWPEPAYLFGGQAKQ